MSEFRVGDKVVVVDVPSYMHSQWFGRRGTVAEIHDRTYGLIHWVAFGRKDKLPFSRQELAHARGLFA